MVSELGRGRRRVIGRLTLVLLLAVVGACSSDDSAADAPSSTAPPAASVEGCTDLAVSFLGVDTGAEGQVVGTFGVRNTASGECVVDRAVTVKLLAEDRRVLLEVPGPRIGPSPAMLERGPLPPIGLPPKSSHLGDAGMATLRVIWRTGDLAGACPGGQVVPDRVRFRFNGGGSQSTVPNQPPTQSDRIAACGGYVYATALTAPGEG